MSEQERRARVLPLRGSPELYDDDAALAHALIERRPTAPAALWERFAPMVHRMLRRTLGPGHDVDDVVQEVFLCVFQKVAGLREPRALRAFVISVTALTARYELRRRWVPGWNGWCAWRATRWARSCRHANRPACSGCRSGWCRSRRRRGCARACSGRRGWAWRWRWAAPLWPAPCWCARCAPPSPSA